MSAPDFYFAINSMARYLHDHYGKETLVDYWRQLGKEYYAGRIANWRRGGAEAIAADWREYFSHEPGAQVNVTVVATGADAGADAGGSIVELDIAVCPAIKHMRDCGREIVPYFCEHCDHTCSAMAEEAGFTFERIGGMGTCRQRFVPLTAGGRAL